MRSRIHSAYDTLLAVLFCTTLSWILIQPTTASFSAVDLALNRTAIVSGIIALLGIARSKIRIGIKDALVFILMPYLCVMADGDTAVISKTAALTALYMTARVLSSVSAKKFQMTVVLLVGASGIYQALYGLGQIVGLTHSNHSLFALTGTFFNPGPYGGFLALALCTCAGYLAGQPFPKFKTIENSVGSVIFITAAACVLLCGVMLPATLSRAAMVAVGGYAVLLCMSNRRYRTDLMRLVQGGRFRRVTVCSIALSAIVFIAMLFWIKRDSAVGRLHIWDISLRAIIENPKGVGLGHFAGAFGQTQAEYFANNGTTSLRAYVAGCPEYGFNDLLQAGVETGILGITLLTSLFALSLKGVDRNNPLKAGLFALLLFSLFSYPLNLIPFQIFAAVFCGFSEPGNTKPHMSSKIIAGTMLIACCAIIGVTHNSNRKTLKTFQDWENAHRWFSMEYYEYVLEDYPKFMDDLDRNPQYLYEYGYALHKKGHYAKSNDILRQGASFSADPMFYNVIGKNYMALGEYDNAEKCYKHAYNRLPNRIYPLYLLTKLYAECGWIEQAMEMGRIFSVQTPKVASPATRELQTEIKHICDSLDNICK